MPAEALDGAQAIATYIGAHVCMGFNLRGARRGARQCVRSLSGSAKNEPSAMV